MSAQQAVKRYRLTCECGRELLVDRSQAGLRLLCECGREVEVPTIRGLNDLSPVVEARATSSWTNRQALLLLGAIIAAIGLGWGAYRQFFPPRLPFTMADIDAETEYFGKAIEKAPADEVYKLWEDLSSQLDRRELRDITQHRLALEHNRRWMYVMYALGAAGLVIAASAFAIRS